MANSSTVANGGSMKASEYNNLRLDVLDTTTGHSHTGADSAQLGAGSDADKVDGYEAQHLRAISAFFG